jgi:hypothetical protein
MAVAVALREQEILERAPTHEEVLARYRRLRAISKEHHSKILDLISQDAILRCARRLGLACGRTFILDDMDDLDLAYDLAIHSAEPGRSRAIDRYARSAQLSPGSDEAMVLAAMCRARFSIVSVERRHEAAGLILKDLVRGTQHWLVDIGLESSIPDKFVMTSRLYTPNDFSMTSGVNIPLTQPLLDEAFDQLPQLYRKPLREAIDDRRFAEAIYRVALENGVMARVLHQDVTLADA